MLLAENARAIAALPKDHLHLSGGPKDVKSVESRVRWRACRLQANGRIEGVKLVPRQDSPKAPEGGPRRAGEGKSDSRAVRGSVAGPFLKPLITCYG